MRTILSKKTVIYAVVAFFSVSLFGQNGRTASIEFNKLVHDFGDIQLNSGKQSHTFTFKNISQQPIVIQTVISSCGCTTPEWTKSPVKPGESGKIEVTFLNDQGPYPFDKSLTVYVTGTPKPIILRIKGVVHEKQKSLKQLFPEIFGQMALRKSPVDVGQIMQGSVDRETIEIANTSGTPIKVTFADLTKGLTLNVNPTTIEAGSKGELVVNIDTKAENNWGLTSYQAIPVVNGKRVSKKLVIQATIREDFSNLKKGEIDQSPLPMASKSSFNFGSIPSGSKIETTFEIKNLGRRDLVIHKIDVSEGKADINYPGKIAPGSIGKISVSINTAGHFGEKIYILTLITNSPSRPLVNLLVTGQITK